MRYLHNIAHAKKPSFWRQTYAIYYAVDHTFESLVTTLKRVLLMVAYLAPPNPNPEHAKKDFNLVTLVFASMITKKILSASYLQMILFNDASNECTSASRVNFNNMALLIKVHLCNDMPAI